jgi:3-deoxy-D-manno-octulosonic-acid transferase
MSVIYNALLLFARFGYALAGRFNTKARAFNAGRRDIFKRLTNTLGSNTAPIIWVHCASLGEFEQGRPVIEKLKLEFPQI